MTKQLPQWKVDDIKRVQAANGCTYEEAVKAYELLCSLPY